MPDEKISTLRRIRLPDQRSGETRKVEFNSFDLYLTVNFYENDQPGEILIKVAKMGSLISGMTDVICIECSILLQVGVPATRVFKIMSDIQFEPNTPKHTSIVDAIATTALAAISARGGRPDLDHDLRTVDWKGSL